MANAAGGTRLLQGIKSAMEGIRTGGTYKCLLEHSFSCLLSTCIGATRTAGRAGSLSVVFGFGIRAYMALNILGCQALMTMPFHDTMRCRAHSDPPTIPQQISPHFFFCFFLFELASLPLDSPPDLSTCLCLIYAVTTFCTDPTSCFGWL